MFFETPRLLLRRFREEDFADYCDYAIDEEMCRMLHTDFPRTPEESRFCFDWKLNRECERWYALVLKENGKVIGGLTVHPLAEHLAGREDLRGKTGCSLSFAVSRHYQRRGLMEEALRAAIPALFAEGMDYIQSGYLDFNTPSAALHKKLGFELLCTECFTDEGVEYVGLEHILWKK